MPTGLPIFSPSRTKTWKECSLKLQLERRGWQPVDPGKPALARFAGVAFAEAVALYQVGLRDNIGYSAANLADVALSAFARECGHFLGAGGHLDEQDRLTIGDDLEEHLRKYVLANPFSAWRVEDIELPFPNHGLARIDLGGYDNFGILSVADIKYKRYLSAEYVDTTIEEYRHDWQFYHYAWAYGEFKEQPCRRAWLCLVVGAPRFRVTLVPFDIDPQAHAIWLQSARQAWKDMHDEDTGQRPVTIAATHRTRFGWCPYKNACLLYCLDEDMMRQGGYIQVPRVYAGEELHA